MDLCHLYEKYVNEREGGEVLKKPYGFITYKINNEECFIINMFIDKSSRKMSFSKELVGELAEIAVSRGCSFISGNIQDNDPGCTQTMAAAIGNGFKIYRADRGQIDVIKSLKGAE